VARDTLQPELGTRLRALRRERGLKLADVSGGTGISSSFLSLVESGKNDVTISRLAKLCNFYGISVGAVLPGDSAGDSRVLRRGEQRHFFSPSEGVDLSMLGPSSGTLMAPYALELDPGGQLSEPVRCEREVVLVVTAGTLEVTLDDEPILLEDGDSVYVMPGRLLDYRNPDGTDSATALAVVSRVDSPG
jgi:transcriptional regulator with XRE-family HTH domain